MPLITTNDQRLLHDLEETVQAFGDVIPENTEIRHQFHRENGKDIHSFVLQSGDSMRKTELPTETPPVHDAVEELRLVRRAAKLGLYSLLKEFSGKTFAWGSLTGIRPTHLCRQLIKEYGNLEKATEILQSVFDVSYTKTALVRDILINQAGFYRWGDDAVADLYIGIPFCKTRCLYCSFVSADLTNRRVCNLVEPYVNALIREIEETAVLLRDMGKKPGCLYIGGGTPSSIGTKPLRRILEALHTAFPDAQEWTVEAGRPDTMDADMLRMLKEEKVQRISINPQTMQDSTLSLIGRKHTAENVLQALEIASGLGFDSVNMDLIMGLPGETLAMVEGTLSQIAKLPIDNLTVHTLSVKRSSRLHEFLERYPLPGAEDVYHMVEMGRETAAAMGMQPYYLYRQKYMTGNLENVGYALPGKICRYNVDMMEETHHVVAMGAGSISRRMYFEQDRHERFAHPKNADYYLSNFDELLQKKREFFMKGTENTSC